MCNSKNVFLTSNWIREFLFLLYRKQFRIESNFRHALPQVWPLALSSSFFRHPTRRVPPAAGPFDPGRRDQRDPRGPGRRQFGGQGADPQDPGTADAAAGFGGDRTGSGPHGAGCPPEEVPGHGGGTPEKEGRIEGTADARWTDQGKELLFGSVSFLWFKGSIFRRIFLPSFVYVRCMMMNRSRSYFWIVRTK